MDEASGIFTAPRSGIYFFSFMTEVEFPAVSSPDRVRTDILLLKNNQEVARVGFSETNTVDYQVDLLTLPATLLNLKSGDQVWLILIQISPGAYLNGDGYRNTHFSGFYLEEEIVASL